MAYRIFLKLLIKLGFLKGKQLMELDFWKKSHFEDNAQKSPQNKVYWIFQTISPLIYIFFEFKSCTELTFTILLKLHVWEKSNCRVKYKNVLSQSDCRILTLRFQKLKVVLSWFCACSFICIKVINWLCKFSWVWSGMLRHAQRDF